MKFKIKAKEQITYEQVENSLYDFGSLLSQYIHNKINLPESYKIYISKMNKFLDNLEKLLADTKKYGIK